MPIQIIFYGAGQYAVRMLRPNLVRKGAFLPPPVTHGVCFADADESKHGSSLFGLQVLSVKTALEQFPNADIYLMLGSMEMRHEACCALQTLGVSPSRILNPVVCRLSCSYLEYFVVCGYHEGAFNGRAGTDYGSHSLKSCCSDYGKNNVDFVPIGDSLSEAFDAFICLRDSIVHKLNIGESTCCDGCKELKKMYVPAQSYFSYIIFNELGRCNCKCIYCNYEERLGRDVCSDADIDQLLSLVQQYGFDNDNGIIELCNGEITIHPQKKDIYKAVNDNNVMFLTNGLIFDEEILRKLQNGTGILNISLDCGTKDTFFNIKGLDKFEEVLENLRRYNLDRKGALHLKYILIPGSNDNFTDVNGFVSICAELEVTSAHISFDLRQPKEAFTNEKTRSALSHMLKKLETYAIPFEIYQRDVLLL